MQNNYQHGAQTITRKEVEDFLGSDLAGLSPPFAWNAKNPSSGRLTEEIAFEVFFGNNSYGFILIPTDDNRLIFQKEYFGYHGYWKNESIVARGHSEAMWNADAKNNIDRYVIPILQKQNCRVL